MKTQTRFLKPACVALLAVVGLYTHASETPLLKLRAVPFTDVKITDSFWAPRQETNRVVSIPINFENLEKAGNLQNFRLAAQRFAFG